MSKRNAISPSNKKYWLGLVLAIALACISQPAVLASVDQDAMEQVQKTSRAFIGISKKAIPMPWKSANG